MQAVQYSLALYLVYILSSETVVNGLDNGLALTPPMGWMHWERFRCAIDCKSDPKDCLGERLIKETADAMVAGGFREAGYQYVSIDDCWMLPERGPDGQLQPDPARFPNGMKALADYVHSKGLKLGIYEDMGTLTCKKYPGSKFYLQGDAITFASWGIDMLKLDCCYAGGLTDLEEGYQAMGFFLNQTQRHILFSCSWPACSGGQTKYDLVAKHCNMWRNYKDVRDSWQSVYQAIDFYGNDTDHFQHIAGPGHWNDPDQLILGDFGLSYDQERVQMGMWCMMASPLFMSVDLRNIRNSSRDLLLNKNLLAIHNDEFGIQGYRLFKRDGIELWLKPLMGSKFIKGTIAIAVLNSLDYGGPVPFSATLKDIGLSQPTGYHIIEAFKGSDMGKYELSDKLQFAVNPVGIYIVIATPVGALPSVFHN